MEEFLEHLATYQARAVLLSAYSLLTMILRVEYCGMSLIRFFVNMKLMMQVRTEVILCSALHVTAERTTTTALATIYRVAELHQRSHFLVQ